MSTTDILLLHKEFCQETGMELRLGLGEYSRERAWHEFHKAGFTAEDLRLVIRHLKKKIKDKERNPGALKFSNLIERPEAFEEELGLAKAEQRNAKPAPTPKERVVQAFRPAAAPAAPSQTAKPIAEYIEALRKSAG